LSAFKICTLAPIWRGNSGGGHVTRESGQNTEAGHVTLRIRTTFTGAHALTRKTEHRLCPQTLPPSLLLPFTTRNQMAQLAVVALIFALFAGGNLLLSDLRSSSHPRSLRSEPHLQLSLLLHDPLWSAELQHLLPRYSLASRYQSHSFSVRLPRHLHWFRCRYRSRPRRLARQLPCGRPGGAPC
jgi:hypothetical protein